jgi:hypothetical protein
MIRSHCFCFTILATLLIAQFPLVAAEKARVLPAYKQEVQPVLAKHCFRCHGEKKQEGDLRLDNLNSDFSDGAAAETWHDVLNKLNLGEMPPEDEKQPTAAEFNNVVDWLTLELKRVAAAKQSTGGHVVLRRLTRYEYNNTLCDLLGIDFNFSEDLPPEPSSEDGFQNSGAALGMSPLQIELYLQAARLALSKVIVTGDEPEIFKHHIEESTARKKNNVAAEPNQLTPGTSFVARILEFPREGEIVVRVHAGAIVSEGAPYPRMRLTLGMRSDVLTAEEAFAEVDVTASADEPEVYEFRGRIERYPLPGHNPKFPGIMVTVWNGEPGAKPAKKKKNKKDESQDSPAKAEIVSTIVVKSVDFEGPVFKSWPPESHTNILFARETNEDEASYARQVISKFASRAYRRPASETEVELLTSFYEKIRPQWPTFEGAIRETLAMVLVSPEFLYLMEPNDRPGKKQLLTDYELASRLSYFLWSSMPDEKLFDLAENGQLRKPNVLAKQVREMIANPKSENFVNNFTDQWLNLSGIDRVAVNPEYYPTFDDNLKRDMRRETQAFFAEILQKDLSALNLIDSDFAMLNRPLAKHYGIEGPRGQTFERVALSPADRRGGLLTQGSVLLSNSTGEDSHPIRRAVWLLDRLLNNPPPPPPPDVPELDSDEPDFASLPLKEQLEIHRKKESCNNCHRKIDPWGIAFENYDAIGKWRTEVLRAPKKGRGKTSPVVSNSTLPGGHEIDGLPDLKKHLLEHQRERFSRALVAKLLTYGLGRSLEFTDEEIVESLSKKFADADYRISDLIVAIVEAEPFQHK